MGEGLAMLLVKKMNFSEEEIGLMLSDLDGYVWVVLDAKKGIIAAGDDYVGDMKNALLKMKCSIYDIFGVGFDLVTGEIDFYSPANKKLVDKNSTTEVPDEKRERIETLVKYFFGEVPALKLAKRKPRYSKRV
jgi:hypothetical protein